MDDLVKQMRLFASAARTVSMQVDGAVDGIEQLSADAARFRWLLNGNGYFLEEEGICGHEPCSESEQREARRKIDEAMATDKDRWKLRGR